MLRHVQVAATASLLAVIAGSPAYAENRVALVIGNSAYRAVAALPNAQNDARGMAGLLSEAGFDVTHSPDQSQDDLRKTISQFAKKLAGKGPDTVAVVFYAGHGIQVDGENFLVPVDIDPQLEADVPLQAVRLNDLLNTLNATPNKMRILMLDACRNNPFPAIKETTGRGLAMVDTKSGAPGTFISYSTSPGSEAEDGDGANSPYTLALLRIAREPGLPIEEAFKRVRVTVNEVTEGRQVPWESSSLTSDFTFFSGPRPVAGGQMQRVSQTSPTAGAAPAKSVNDWKIELLSKDSTTAYRTVIAEDSLEAYRAFMSLYPQSSARIRVLADRRQEMIAWNTTVTANTVASYRSFATTYPGSDLAATARKLEERSRNRSLNANAATAPGPAAAGAPAPPNSTPINVATAPATCPCTIQQAPPAKKKEASKQPPARRADPPPSRRAQPPGADQIGAAAGAIIPALVGSGVMGDGLTGGMGGHPQGGASYPPAGNYPPAGGGQSAGGGYSSGAGSSRSGGYSNPSSESMTPHGR